MLVPVCSLTPIFLNTLSTLGVMMGLGDADTKQIKQPVLGLGGTQCSETNISALNGMRMVMRQQISKSKLI